MNCPICNTQCDTLIEVSLKERNQSTKEFKEVGWVMCIKCSNKIGDMVRIYVSLLRDPKIAKDL